MTVNKQRYEMGISENNLRHWGELHAVKELLQNAVYAKTILKNDISIEYKNGRAYISNTPDGFTKGKLLIGESEQAGTIGAPGEYGEGMKMGMAVARRLGLECHVQTNGFTVHPELEPSSIDPSVKVLVFYIEDTDLNEGTKFIIECSESTLEEAKTYFAVLQGLDSERTKVDNIMRDFTGIYANGVKITETPAKFGYNFVNAELINRDRSTVDMEKLKDNTRSLLSLVRDEEVITELVEAINEDDGLLESQSGIYSSSATQAWKRVIEKVFGKKVALATGTESDTAARYRNFKVLANLPKSWKYFFSDSLDILPSNELRETTVDTNKHKKASAEENKNLGWAKRLVKLYYADYGTVKISEVVVDGYGNPAYGLYDPKTDSIWIRRDMLSNKKDLFQTLLHETIHRNTGADDNTTAFTRGWEEATWGILNRGKA